MHWTLKQAEWMPFPFNCRAELHKCKSSLQISSDGTLFPFFTLFSSSQFRDFSTRTQFLCILASHSFDHNYFFLTRETVFWTGFYTKVSSLKEGNAFFFFFNIRYHICPTTQNDFISRYTPVRERNSRGKLHLEIALHQVWPSFFTHPTKWSV